MGIERQVLDSNPLLEAFGNAKTFKNNNSSRFGKFIKVNFDSSGKIRCAQIKQYLLEKSRVVFQLQNERNFHIFYQVMACKEMAKRYGLGDPKDYRYTSQSGLYTIAGVNDATDFQLTLDCMKNVGFTQQEISQILDIIVAILNLGNVDFVEGSVPGVGTCARIDPQTMHYATEFGKYMGLGDVGDVESLLTVKEQKMMNETLHINLQVNDALATRDSIAKLVYKNLFTWLVDRVNLSISNPGSSSTGTKFIGILDIFGFEIFQQNSFEQLCINYANEKLQHQFNNHMFTLEQEEYKKEKVRWDNIKFSDNLGCIDLIENPKQKSVFKLLDEECMINGSEQTLARKLLDQLQDNRYFARTKGNKFS